MHLSVHGLSKLPKPYSKFNCCCTPCVATQMTKATFKIHPLLHCCHRTMEWATAWTLTADNVCTHCKNGLVALPKQTIGGDSSPERFILILETNCVRQPERSTKIILQLHADLNHWMSVKKSIKSCYKVILHILFWLLGGYLKLMDGLFYQALVTTCTGAFTVVYKQRMCTQVHNGRRKQTVRGGLKDLHATEGSA